MINLADNRITIGCRVAAVVRPGRESRRLNRTESGLAEDRVSSLLCAPVDISNGENL